MEYQQIEEAISKMTQLQCEDLIKIIGDRIVNLQDDKIFRYKSVQVTSDQEHFVEMTVAFRGE